MRPSRGGRLIVTTVLRTLGDPYSEEEIAAAADAVSGKTEMEALVAYLQGLGRARSGR